MDGTLAAIYVLAALLDMGLTDCREAGCLAASDAQSRVWVQGAAVEFDREIIGEEVFVGLDLGTARGPFQPVIGLSANGDGDAWIGAGVKTQWRFGGGWFAEGALMPGYHDRGDGPDLGGSLQFRSALGVGYEFGSGATLSVHYDHRSNGGIETVNPGLETIGLRYAMPLN